MPLITVNNCHCYYRLEGRDEAPVLMLSHSLGADHSMWDEQAAALVPHFRVLRYDTRGHGASQVVVGDYSIDQLGRDALGLADALGIERFAFCGLSLGGMIGQWLGLHAPNRVTHLVLANTSPRPDAKGMEARRQTVLRDGIAAVADAVMGRFFSPAMLAAGPPSVALVRRTLVATDPVGYAGCCAAVRDMDMVAALPAVTVPTLVIGSDVEVSLPWSGHGDVLAASIPGARAVRLPTAHLSNLERPRSFTAAVVEFLRPHAPVLPDSLEEGFAVRRAVLGHAHVDRAVAATTDFTGTFQNLITRLAWGTIWTRPGLDRRTRRLLVLAMMASLGRLEEFRMHVRTGLSGELEPCDLEEVLLQVAVYAGVPAANTAFHIASEELKAKDSQGGAAART